MNKPSRGPTIYVPARYRQEIETLCRASAGPHGNLTGMRKLYWGDGPVIRCGVYLYLVWWDDFCRFRDRR